MRISNVGLAMIALLIFAFPTTSQQGVKDDPKIKKSSLEDSLLMYQKKHLQDINYISRNLDSAKNDLSKSLQNVKRK